MNVKTAKRPSVMGKLKTKAEEYKTVAEDMLEEAVAVDLRDTKLGAKFLRKLEYRNALNEQHKKLEAQVKELNRELANDLATEGIKTVIAGNHRVTFVAGVNTTLSAKALLRLGVPASKIQEATLRTTYETINVTEIKK